jgi:hypothetical protein
MALIPHNAKRAEQTTKRSLVTTIIFALLFVGWVGEWPIEIDPVMYLGLWRSPFGMLGPLFAPVPGIHLFPWQILMICVLPFCRRASPGGQLHAREMDRAIIVSIACIAVTFIWGWVRGGSPYFAYYQVWRFMAALLIAYMLMSAVRTERDLMSLGKIVVVAALIRATLCIYFYWTHVQGKIFPVPEFVTNHDDSMIFVVATLIVSVWALLRGGRAAWITAALVVPYLFYAMIVNTRRIAWVELGLALPLLYFVIEPGPLRTRINRWVKWVAPVAVVYFVLGMSSESGVFAPVHALTTAGSNYDPSSLTRQEEARNLLHTLVDIGNPLFGTGWGRPYDKAESYWSNYNVEWVLTLYTPHNALLGLAAFAGLVGIFGIWGVVPTAAFLAARGYRGCTAAVPRGAAMVTLGALAAYSVHCYGDIGLQSFPVSLIFGVALAVAGKVALWSETAPASAREPAPAAVRTGGGCPAPPLRPSYGKAAAWPRFKPSAPRPGPSAGSDLTPKPKRASTRRSPR